MKFLLGIVLAIVGWVLFWWGALILGKALLELVLPFLVWDVWKAVGLISGGSISLITAVAITESK